MNKNINKKLSTLNIALNSILGKDKISKKSSLKRSVDIESYSAKILGLFFPYLANDLKEMAQEHSAIMKPPEAKQLVPESVEELDKINKKISEIGSKYGINNADEYYDVLNDAARFNSIPDEITQKINRHYNKYKKIKAGPKDLTEQKTTIKLRNYFIKWKNAIIKIYIKPNRAGNKIQVFYENGARGSSKELIKEQSFSNEDLKFFSSEELKIFLASGHVFNIHLRNFHGGDKPFKSGAVTGGDWVVYNAPIQYKDWMPNYLLGNISALYKNLLELVVHESTHVQQFSIGEKAHNISQDMSMEEYALGLNRPNKEYSEWYPDTSSSLPLITDRTYVNTHNKKVRDNWVKSISSEKKLIADDEDITDDYEDGEVTTEDHKDNKVTTEDNFKYEDVKGLFDSSPEGIEYWVNQRLRACPEIADLAKRELSLKAEKGERLNMLVELFEYKDMCEDEKKSILSNNKSETYHTQKDRMNTNSYVKYISKPDEVEAHIRGWRSNLKGSGKTLAYYFGHNYAASLGDDKTISEVWKLYEDAYKRLGYPQKDLGTYSEVLSSNLNMYKNLFK